MLQNPRRGVRNLVQITHDCARPRLSASAPERLGASAPQRISASAPQRFSAPAQVAVVFLPDTIVDRGNAPRFGVRFVRKKRSFVIFGHKFSATLCTSALPRVPPKCDIDRQRGKPTAPPPPKYAKLRRRRGAQPATRRKLPCGAGMRSALQLGGRGGAVERRRQHCIWGGGVVELRRVLCHDGCVVMIKPGPEV